MQVFADGGRDGRGGYIMQRPDISSPSSAKVWYIVLQALTHGQTLCGARAPGRRWPTAFAWAQALWRVRGLHWAVYVCSVAGWLGSGSGVVLFF